MKLERLKQFLDELHMANITPPNGLLIVIDDFEESLPDHVSYIGQCEYNHRIRDNDFLQVEIASKKMLDIGIKQSK